MIHEYATIDLSQLEKLVCSDARSTVVSLTTNAPDYSLESTDLRATVNGLNVNVPFFGTYPMVYKALHPYCPSEARFDLEFTAAPRLNLGNDTTICNRRVYGYRPELLRVTCGRRPKPRRRSWFRKRGLTV